MKKSYFIFCLAVLMVSAHSQVFAQILEWDFYTNNAKAATFGSTYNDPNVSASVLSRGAGASATTSGYSYGFAVSFTGSAIDYATAVANDSYVEFSTTSTTHLISLSGIDVKLRVQAAGGQPANKYRWAYKKTGEPGFTPIGPAVTTITIGDDAGIVQPTLNLAGITALQNIATNTEVTFRLYAWGGNGASSLSTTAIGKSNSSQSSASLMLRGITTLATASLSTNPEIASWQFLDIADPSPATVVATAKDANLSTSVLSRGAGLTAGDFANAYISTMGITSTSLVDAEAANEYYQFEFKSATGYVATIDEILYRYRSFDPTGPSDYQWKYSLDGTTFTNVGSAGLLNKKTDGSDMYLDVSGVAALKNIATAATVTFRLYVWNNSSEVAATGFGRFAHATSSFNSIYFKGKVVEESTLPVKLTSFTGKKELNGINLMWQTASENNNSHFEVYKSSTGKPNVLVGKVNGLGNSTSLNNYSLMDYSPASGTNYYQLIQVDKDGERQEFDVISVNNTIDEVAGMKVYSTETSVQVNIKGATAGAGLLQIIDINGRVVYKGAVNLTGTNTDSVEVLFSNSKGVYIATLTTSSNQVLTTKFVW